jgi:iron complex transport system substrate-binding protein
VVNNYLVMGQRGTASRLLELAGGINAVDATEDMKPMSAEIVASSRPDVILITDFGYDRLSGLDAAKQLPGVALTAAAKNNKIFRVEEHDLVYFGPRTGEIVMNLMQVIHR